MYLKLLQIFSDNKIIYKALEVAEENGDKPAYLIKLLEDWQNKGLKSVAEVETYLKKRKASKGSYEPDLNERARGLHNIEEMEKAGWNQL